MLVLNITNKIFMIILGISLFGFGLGIILDPEFYDSKHQFHYDFSEIRFPFGGFLLVIGSLFLIVALKKKSKELGPKFLICANCLKPLFKNTVVNNQCPECEGELEDLEDFYDRHPELKKENDENPELNS